jgi:hypothetical protein
MRTTLVEITGVQNHAPIPPKDDIVHPYCDTPIFPYHAPFLALFLPLLHLPLYPFNFISPLSFVFAPHSFAFSPSCFIFSPK